MREPRFRLGCLYKRKNCSSGRGSESCRSAWAAATPLKEPSHCPDGCDTAQCSGNHGETRQNFAGSCPGQFLPTSDVHWSEKQSSANESHKQQQQTKATNAVAQKLQKFARLTLFFPRRALPIYDKISVSKLEGLYLILPLCLRLAE